MEVRSNHKLLHIRALFNFPAREQVKTRHNIVRRDCAKHDEWSYTIIVKIVNENN